MMQNIVLSLMFTIHCSQFCIFAHFESHYNVIYNIMHLRNEQMLKILLHLQPNTRMKKKMKTKTTENFHSRLTISTGRKFILRQFSSETRIRNTNKKADKSYGIITYAFLTVLFSFSKILYNKKKNHCSSCCKWKREMIIVAET